MLLYQQLTPYSRDSSLKHLQPCWVVLLSNKFPSFLAMFISPPNLTKTKENSSLLSSSFSPQFLVATLKEDAWFFKT
jgi:hypothetical protein